MVPQDLPSADSPDLHLVLATPKEIQQQLIINSTEWRGALSLEAYLRRETHLSNQDLTRDGGLTSWMLVQGEGASRRVLAGCESIRKEALVAHPRGEVEAVACHGVASVFTPEEFRGRRYAGRMMQELGPRLSEWDGRGKRVGLSVLYSDIGKMFYTKHGWHPFPSSHISLPPTPSTLTLPPSVPLHVADLSALCDADAALLHKRLTNLNPTQRQKTNVALLPNIQTLTWHHAREEFVMHELQSQYPTNSAPGVKGALVGDKDKAGDRAWCYWTRVWANPNEKCGNILHILRLAIDQEGFDDFSPATEEGVKGYENSELVKKVAALFTAAQKAASAWGMRKVQLWNPSSLALAAARLVAGKGGKVEVEAREEDSIASLMWYGEGGEEGVEWVCNEKYAWC